MIWRGHLPRLHRHRRADRGPRRTGAHGVPFLVINPSGMTRTASPGEGGIAGGPQDHNRCREDRRWACPVTGVEILFGSPDCPARRKGPGLCWTGRRPATVTSEAPAVGRPAHDRMSVDRGRSDAYCPRPGGHSRVGSVAVARGMLGVSALVAGLGTVSVGCRPLVASDLDSSRRTRAGAGGVRDDGRP